LVRLDALLDARERGELRDELSGVHRLGRILILHLRGEQLQEGAVIECLRRARRRVVRRVRGRIARPARSRACCTDSHYTASRYLTPLVWPSARMRSSIGTRARMVLSASKMRPCSTCCRARCTPMRSSLLTTASTSHALEHSKTSRAAGTVDGSMS